MNLLVLGATGGTGRHVVDLALAQGHDVAVLVRDPAKVTTKHARLQVIQGDVTNAADVEAAVRGRDAVVGALGPRNKTDPVCADAAAAVVAAMKSAGVRRVVWLSASGVGDSVVGIAKASFVFAKIILPLLLKKPYANHARAEETLRQSGLDWTVLRPLQLVDAPTGRPIVAVAPDAPPTSMKIARRDVAVFILQELAANAHVGRMPMLQA
jgi:uncharacterized protein YbjT (DUF2867 family)